MDGLFDKALSSPPPTLGEGCLSRYDPQALDSEDGTEFPDAARLWDELQQDSQADVPCAPV